MSDLEKLVIAFPLAILFFAIVTAMVIAFDALDKAATHVVDPNPDDLPWYLRRNRQNIVFFSPEMLDSVGREERRKAIMWHVISIVLIIAFVGYIRWARSFGGS